MTAGAAIIRLVASAVDRRVGGLLARIEDHVVWHSVEGDLVLFNSSTGIYHTLDTVGSDVWRTLSECEALGEVVERLTRRYGADPETIESDVADFIEMASRLGLVATRRSGGA